MTQRILLAVQVGKPQSMALADGKNFTSSIYKTPVEGAVWLGSENLDGNFQADLRYHGGPDKAICCFASENYPALSKFLGKELPFGAFGENFTFREMLEDEVCVGDRYEIGGAMIEVSQPRQPCINLTRRWDSKTLPARIVETGMSGWYARVIREGSVEAGLVITLADRPHQDWSITRLNRIMFAEIPDPVELKAAIAIPELSKAWRRDFEFTLKEASQLG